MKHDREKLKLTNERLAELLGIELREDLTDEEKSASISAKMNEYEKHPYAPDIADEGRSVSAPQNVDGKNNSEQEMQMRRRKFDQALKQGRIRIKPLPKE